MAQEVTLDYVERLEKALLEYVEKFGPSDAVRSLYHDREKDSADRSVLVDPSTSGGRKVW